MGSSYHVSSLRGVVIMFLSSIALVIILLSLRAVLIVEKSMRAIINDIVVIEAAVIAQLLPNALLLTSFSLRA